MKPAHLAELTHHRWAAPVLAELHDGKGAKLVTLVSKLGVGRESISRTLKALVERAWVMRNPGHGHPMRPEYVLTSSGKKLGPACAALWRELAARQLQAVAQKKWSLPVLLSLSAGAERFSELRAELPLATPRALTATLKLLVNEGLVLREIVDDYPPRPTYALATQGVALVPLLDQVATAIERGRADAGSKSASRS